jgi:co-chaperonin GroES (HSP10)
VADLDWGKVKALGSRVVVRPMRVGIEHKGSIVLIDGHPDRAGDTPFGKHGRVLAVGDETTSVQRGDRVIFDVLSGKNFDVGRERYLVLEEGDILATVE